MKESIIDKITSSVSSVGEIVLLLLETIREIFRPPYEFSQLFRQLYRVGSESIFVVLITGMVAGFVGAVQAFYQLKPLSAQGMMGGFVAVLVLKELAPMLTAFVMAARICTGFAAEIGTMNVTEQIDALRAMATSPIKYLVVPRVLACAITMPILVIFADVAGIAGGFIISVYFGMSGSLFFQQFNKFLFVSDIIGGLLKGLTFGIIISIVGCYRGLHATGGAEGVGFTTSVSAVHSFILIIIADFLLNYGIYAVLDIF